MDNFFRGFIDKKLKIGKLEIGFIDLLLLAGMTVAGVLIRVIFRSIVTDDWTIFWDPWINELKEGGFGALATDFYDYAPPFVYVLWIISLLPINPMTAYKGLCCCLDFVVAILAAKMIYDLTKSKTKAYGTYSVFMIMPTMVLNSALWAQCDVIYTLFVLLSFYYVLKDKPGVGMFFYGIAFAFKLQSLFIFPVYIVLWAKKKIKIQNFLWIIVMYFVGILPAWIAGRPLMELINIYVAQGTQDVWSLSMKLANIYQVFGATFFTIEYASAGTWLILGILMFIMFYLAYKKYPITREFALKLCLFFAMLTPYFLPHMHERYYYLADVLAILYAFVNPKRFYWAIIQVMLSVNAYMEYLSKTFSGPIKYYSFVQLGLLILVGREIYLYIKENEVVEPVAENIQNKEKANG